MRVIEIKVGCSYIFRTSDCIPSGLYRCICRNCITDSCVFQNKKKGAIWSVCYELIAKMILAGVILYPNKITKALYE